MDLPEARANLRRFRAAVRLPVVSISCATGAGIPTLIQTTWERLHHAA
jgi:hypothetical protein